MRSPVRAITPPDTIVSSVIAPNRPHRSRPSHTQAVWVAELCPINSPRTPDFPVTPERFHFLKGVLVRLQTLYPNARSVGHGRVAPPRSPRAGREPLDNPAQYPPLIV